MTDDPNTGSSPMGSARPQRILDLHAVEVDDGPALARMVSRLRGLAERGTTLVLRNCPQLLAHTLYKSAMLGTDHIRIESMRTEEPYG